LKPDAFTAEDVKLAEAIARWVGIVAHKAELGQEIARNSVAQGRRAAAEELVTVLAHDLRNVVSPMTMRLELLCRRAQKDGRDVDVRDCDAARRAVRRLDRLISDLLDVARLDQGVFRIEAQPTDLAAIASDASGTLATPEHPVNIDCSEPTVVLADPDRVRQCV